MAARRPPAWTVRRLPRSGSLMPRMCWRGTSRPRWSPAGRVPGGAGEDVVDELLNAYGQPLFEEARQAVRETLAHYMADSGPRVRIVDRRPALLDNRGLQSPS
ncbi:hypothetical protein ACFTXM_15175 [Streptomyces sp. NPDC056930]|uniref:hypothetical protein n=1 Tax=Streptomyces sp. NPDC056930 TaxID=3345967 RepID=UPI003635D941